MRINRILLLAMLICSGWCKAQENVVTLTDQCEVEFADLEAGKTLLAANDLFMQRMQLLERQIRLQSSLEVKEEQYIASLQAGVIAWKQEEIDRLKDVIAQLKTAFEPYQLPFPKSIYLVRVAAKVESNAPHCRGPAVVLPDRFFAEPEEQPKILAHELFHVMSSHNPELRDQVYKIIGFERCNEIALPEALRHRRLTNPDAPTYEHFIRLEHEGKSLAVTPITFTNIEEYQDQGLFESIVFQLMEVEAVNGKTQPKLDADGEPILYGPAALPDFLRKIGSNTGYIIHPEETMADNFWMLVLQAPEVPDPWVIDKLRETLKRR